MHIITLPAQHHLDYLLYVFHQHVKGGLDPQELDIAAEMWRILKGVREIDLTEEKPTVKLPGLSIVHNGDVSIPITEEEAGAMGAGR